MMLIFPDKILLELESQRQNLFRVLEMPKKKCSISLHCLHGLHGLRST